MKEQMDCHAAQSCCICRKSVLQNIDEDILTKQYFLRAHKEERKGLETGLLDVLADDSLVFG
jgi:hypothetical protein